MADAPGINGLEADPATVISALSPLFISALVNALGHPG